MKTRAVTVAVVVLICVAVAIKVYLHVTMPQVDVIHPLKGPAVQAVYATGTVEATVMMPIAARSSARLTELDADEGYEVKKGQLLARLEDEDLQKNIAALQAQAIYDKQDLDRKEKLIQTNAVSISAVDEARSTLQAAEAAVAKAQAEAGYMKLVAPADGLIIRRDGEVGEMIPAGQAVFWMSCCAPLRISADVDEEDIAQVEPGQEVLIRADAFPGKIFHGKVQAITPKGDPIARSYRVRIGFTEDVPLKIGMTAENNVIISQHDDAILVPNGAIQKNNTVWLVKNGRLVPQQVKTGAKGLEDTEIVSGLTTDDTVVEKPGKDMKAGGTVRPSLDSWKL